MGLAFDTHGGLFGKTTGGLLRVSKAASKIHANIDFFNLIVAVDLVEHLLILTRTKPSIRARLNVGFVQWD